MSLGRFNGIPIYPLASKTGLTAWVDYLPVKQESDGRALSYDNEGFFSASSILSSVAAGVVLTDRDGLALAQPIDTAASANNVALDQTYVALADLTLEALASALIPPRKVTMTSGAAENHSGTVFSIQGFNENGAAASEDLVGPNNSTVTSVNVYSSVTTITPDVTEAVISCSVGSAANAVPYQMTLNGVYGNGLNTPSDPFTPSLVTVYSSGNITTISFSIHGLDANGDAYVERVTGGNNAVVASKRQFARVDLVTPSDDLITVQVEIGLLSSAMVGWTDYIPVYVEVGQTVPWSTESAGFVPFEDVTA